MGVIPLKDSNVPDGPLNTFTVYDERIATSETFSGVILMRDPRDVSQYLELFTFYEQYADFDDDAPHAAGIVCCWVPVGRVVSCLLFQYANNSVTGI